MLHELGAQRDIVELHVADIFGVALWARDGPSPDRQHRLARETRQQPAQIVEAKRDTAPGRREIRPRAMKKDRAAAIFAARMDIVI